MPPRAANKKRQSKSKKQGTIVPIYEQLLTSQSQNVIQKLISDLQRCYENDKQNNEICLKKSFLAMTIHICGLGQLSNKIQWQHPKQSLLDIMEELYEEPDLAISKNSIFIDHKNGQHIQFKKRLRQFLTVLINDVFFVFKSDMIEDFIAWIQVLSMCKIRAIRLASLELMKEIVIRQVLFCNELLDERKSSKATLICSNIEKYLKKIIRPRLKDIDNSIRSTLFETILSILTNLQIQFLTIENLDFIFTEILVENSPTIVSAAMKILREVYQKADHKMNGVLVEYYKKQKAVLEDYCMLPNKTGVQSLEILLSVQKRQPAIESLKVKFVSKVFQIYGCQQYTQGLQKAVQIFYISLSKDYLELDPKIIIVEIINLLSIIGCRKFINAIIHAFIDFKKQLISLDDMFLLLMSQFYHSGSQDIQLKPKQIQSLLFLILQWSQYVRKLKQSKKQQWKNQIKQKYNKNVLNNCKEILLEKISRYSNYAYLYLGLFSHLFVPLESSVSIYVNLIIERVIILFDSNSQSQILNECVNIFHTLKTHNINLLCDKINTQKIQNNNFEHDQITKISCILSKYNKKQFYNNPPLIKNILDRFGYTRNQRINLEILSIMYMVHLWMFKQLIENPTENYHKYYMEFRDMLMNFIFKPLQNAQESIVIRLATFVVICQILQTCANNKIADLPIVYYELSSQKSDIMMNFIQQHIKKPQQSSAGQLSFLLTNLSFEQTQVKSQILKNIINLFESCYKIAIQKQSIRLILFLLQDENYSKRINRFFENLIFQQTKQQNSNKFIFWRIVIEIITVLDQDKGNKELLSKIMDGYFKKKYSLNCNKVLLDKLILFLADCIDRILANSQYQRLQYLEIILKKSYRRYNKNILQRLTQFFNSKTTHLQSQSITSFRKYLQKVSHQQQQINKTNEQSDNNEQQNQE